MKTSPFGVLVIGGFVSVIVVSLLEQIDSRLAWIYIIIILLSVVMLYQANFWNNVNFTIGILKRG